MSKSTDNKKLLAIITSSISVLIGLFYLLMITILDARGSMLPPPPEAFGEEVIVDDGFSEVDQQPSGMLTS